MRPTIEEQLDGARRLLRLAETTPDLPDDARDHIRNAGRLVERVAGSWSAAVGFLTEDNRRLAELLATDAPDADGAAESLATVAARNERLRTDLCARIRALPPGPERDAIGRYLRARADADPT